MLGRLCVESVFACILKGCLKPLMTSDLLVNRHPEREGRGSCKSCTKCKNLLCLAFELKRYLAGLPPRMRKHLSLLLGLAALLQSFLRQATPKEFQVSTLLF